MFLLHSFGTIHRFCAAVEDEFVSRSLQ